MRCSFCSAESEEALELFSICWAMNSRQLTRWLMPKLTATLSTVSKAMGSSQLGFLTMSSKVFPGEKKTPKMRPIALIVGCDGSGLGAGGAMVVDMRTPPPQIEKRTLPCLYYAGASG